MNENTINPFLKNAQSRINGLKAFMEQAKQDAVQPPSDSVYVNKALDRARGIVLGHAETVDLLKRTYELYQGLRVRDVGNLQAKTYLFSTGVDLAVRSAAIPFLLSAGGLIKKLLRPDVLDILAEKISQIFEEFAPDDVNRLLEYLKKTPMAARIPEKKLKRKLNEILKEKAYFIGTEVEAHEDALKNLGYDESEIPGYLLILGYMAGLVTAKVFPEQLSGPE